MALWWPCCWRGPGGDLEIIAFKAAGVSVLRLFRPVVWPH